MNPLSKMIALELGLLIFTLLRALEPAFFILEFGVSISGNYL
jgi:hypothetical protein